MPLYLRAKRDHYPDDAAHVRFKHDGHLVLSGSLVAGSASPSARLHEEHRLDWGGGFCASWDGGTVDSLNDAKEKIAGAFRAAIARCGLAERADARPGPPERDPAPPLAAMCRPPAPSSDADHPIVIHSPRRFLVYSAELLIGTLDEAARVPWVGQWSWSCSGPRQRPHGFVWKGSERSAEAARDAIEACWRDWLAWAGLEPIRPTRWTSA